LRARTDDAAGGPAIGSEIANQASTPIMARQPAITNCAALGACHFIETLGPKPARTEIEYGIIATGIAVAIIPAITGLGTKLKTAFSAISTVLK